MLRWRLILRIFQGDFVISYQFYFGFVFLFFCLEGLFIVLVLLIQVQFKFSFWSFFMDYCFFSYFFQRQVRGFFCMFLESEFWRQVFFICCYFIVFFGKEFVFLKGKYRCDRQEGSYFWEFGGSIGVLNRFIISSILIRNYVCGFIFLTCVSRI